MINMWADFALVMGSLVLLAGLLSLPFGIKETIKWLKEKDKDNLKG